MLRKSTTLIASAVAMGVMGAGGQAEAQVACINGANPGACTNAAGQTRTVITTGNPGASVTNAGTVNDVVQTSGNNSPVNNSGIVGDNALSADGITTTGTNSDVSNSGTVVGTVETTGAESSVGNSGTVQNRIITRRDNSSITNSGTVENGIQTQGNSSNITNSATVRNDIQTLGDNSVVVNSGTAENSIFTFGHNSGVTNSGTVQDLIVTSGDNSDVLNSGTVESAITTRGDNSAIVNGGTAGDLITRGANSVVTNAGTVQTEIFTGGDNSGVTNSGTVEDTIITTGNNSGVTNSGLVLDDIVTFGTNSGITNSGQVVDSINTQGDNSGVTNSGIAGNVSTRGANAGVTNTGTVQQDIDTSGDSSSVTNSGTVGGFISTGGVGSNITNSGVVEVAITSGLNADLTNSGTITVFAQLIGNGSTLTNSGRIGTSGRDNVSIILDGQNQTLTLLSGSIVNERINVMSPGTATLNFGPGLNALLTMNIGMPTTVNGLVVAVSGNQVAALDATGFSVQDDMLADLTSGIFNSVYGRLAGGGGAAFSGSGGMQLGMSPMMQLGMMNLGTTDEPVSASPQSREGVWGDVFGGQRQDDGGGNTIGSDTDYFGGIAGIDGSISPGVLVGAFGGAARSDLDVDANQQTLDGDSYFGGAYASLRASSYFANLIVTAGQTDYDSTRFINNNLAPGGIETATASYDGTFVSPELSIGTTYSLGGIAIEPSVRGRYAFLSLDGYTETGSAAAVTVADRDVSLWLGRVQVAFPVSNHNATFAPRLGVEAWTSDSDDVSAILLGQAIGFAPGGDDSQVTGFLGATATVNISGSVSAFLDGEVHAGDDGFDRSEGRAGLKINF